MEPSKRNRLEPYQDEILLMARHGRSMQSIAVWLSAPPRKILITRQGVHSWIKARQKKLRKLNDDFQHTGILYSDPALKIRKSFALAEDDVINEHSNQSEAVKGKRSTVEESEVKRKINLSSFKMSNDKFRQVEDPLAGRLRDQSSSMK